MNTEVIHAHDHVAHPAPLGLVRATETALFIASPLLAAGSLSLIGVVCADAGHFRFAGPALVLIVAAVISLLLSIQLGYHARQWIYSYEELRSWTGQQAPSLAQLKNQATHFQKGKAKLERAGMAYDVGTVLLGFGIALVLVPRGHNDLAWCRWIATGLVSAAAAGQALWILNTYFRWRYWLLRRRAVRAQQSLKKVDQRDK
ncbi:hypothetical protein [Streptomyces griseorubiginosus]|uniref:hypothetical protein n=1 Tax=Streptomyces griseorubiginosus TaxID=67304 RepID=UPI0036EF98B1